MIFDFYKILCQLLLYGWYVFEFSCLLVYCDWCGPKVETWLWLANIDRLKFWLIVWIHTKSCQVMIIE